MQTLSNIWSRPTYSSSGNLAYILVGSLYMLICVFVIGPALLGQSLKGLLLGGVSFLGLIAFGVVVLAAVQTLGVALITYGMFALLMLFVGNYFRAK